MTLDMSEEDKIPYFMWDYGYTIREIKDILAGTNESKKLQMMGKILRDARYADVWKFFGVQDFLRYRQKLVPFAGRRRKFWEFMYDRWIQYGLIDDIENSHTLAK